MEILGGMIRSKKVLKMFFDLKISFPGIEIKSGAVNLKSFLGTNDQVARSIEHICSFRSHVNFAETIISGLSINGEINSVFNHRKFSATLKNFQSEIESKWEGHFTYYDGRSGYIFYAPNFDRNKLQAESASE